MPDTRTDSSTPKLGVEVGHGRLLRRDLYAIAFLLIIATIISTASFGDGPWGLLASLVLQTITLWVVLLASNVGPKVRNVALAVAGLAVVGAGITVLTGDLQLAKIASSTTMILLVGVTPALIVRTLASRPMINMTTVMGAADIYLLFGLFFSVVFTLVGAIIGHGTTSAEQAFFYSSRPLSPSDFIYYSYVTLTTVGYGDITAATSLGRMLSVTEALLGQLYLVTVVALLVGNFGRSRPTRSADGSGSAITADD